MHCMLASDRSKVNCSAIFMTTLPFICSNHGAEIFNIRESWVTLPRGVSESLRNQLNVVADSRGIALVAYQTNINTCDADDVVFEEGDTILPTSEYAEFALRTYHESPEKIYRYHSSSYATESQQREKLDENNATLIIERELLLKLHWIHALSKLAAHVRKYTSCRYSLVRLLVDITLKCLTRELIPKLAKLGVTLTFEKNACDFIDNEDGARKSYAYGLAGNSTARLSKPLVRYLDSIIRENFVVVPNSKQWHSSGSSSNFKQPNGHCKFINNKIAYLSQSRMQLITLYLRYYFVEGSFRQNECEALVAQETMIENCIRNVFREHYFSVERNGAALRAALRKPLLNQYDASAESLKQIASLRNNNNNNNNNNSNNNNENENDDDNLHQRLINTSTTTRRRQTFSREYMEKVTVCVLADSLSAHCLAIINACSLPMSTKLINYKNGVSVDTFFDYMIHDSLSDVFNGHKTEIAFSLSCLDAGRFRINVKSDANTFCVDTDKLDPWSTEPVDCDEVFAARNDMIFENQQREDNNNLNLTTTSTSEPPWSSDDERRRRYCDSPDADDDDDDYKYFGNKGCKKKRTKKYHKDLISDDNVDDNNLNNCSRHTEKKKGKQQKKKNNNNNLALKLSKDYSAYNKLNTPFSVTKQHPTITTISNNDNNINNDDDDDDDDNDNDNDNNSATSLNSTGFAEIYRRFQNIRRLANDNNNDNDNDSSSTNNDTNLEKFSFPKQPLHQSTPKKRMTNNLMSSNAKSKNNFERFQSDVFGNLMFRQTNNNINNDTQQRGNNNIDNVKNTNTNTSSNRITTTTITVAPNENADTSNQPATTTPELLFHRSNYNNNVRENSYNNNKNNPNNTNIDDEMSFHYRNDDYNDDADHDDDDDNNDDDDDNGDVIESMNVDSNGHALYERLLTPVEVRLERLPNSVINAYTRKIASRVEKDEEENNRRDDRDGHDNNENSARDGASVAENIIHFDDSSSPYIPVIATTTTTTTTTKTDKVTNIDWETETDISSADEKMSIDIGASLNQTPDDKIDKDNNLQQQQQQQQQQRDEVENEKVRESEKQQQHEEEEEEQHQQREENVIQQRNKIHEMDDKTQSFEKRTSTKSRTSNEKGKSIEGNNYSQLLSEDSDHPDSIHDDDNNDSDDVVVIEDEDDLHSHDDRNDEDEKEAKRSQKHRNNDSLADAVTGSLFHTPSGQDVPTNFEKSLLSSSNKQINQSSSTSFRINRKLSFVSDDNCSLSSLSNAKTSRAREAMRREHHQAQLSSFMSEEDDDGDDDNENEASLEQLLEEIEAKKARRNSNVKKNFSNFKRLSNDDDDSSISANEGMSQQQPQHQQQQQQAVNESRGTRDKSPTRSTKMKTTPQRRQRRQRRRQNTPSFSVDDDDGHTNETTKFYYNTRSRSKMQK